MKKKIFLKKFLMKKKYFYEILKKIIKKKKYFYSSNEKKNIF